MGGRGLWVLGVVLGLGAGGPAAHAAPQEAAPRPAARAAGDAAFAAEPREVAPPGAVTVMGNPPPRAASGPGGDAGARDVVVRAPAAKTPTRPPLSRRLAASATRMAGARSVHAFTRALPDDCTGVVRWVYEREGLDLMPYGSRPGENGVTAMWRQVRVWGRHTRTPRPGDLAFFRESYDRNRDGRRNDGLTHVAVVESVARDGTVTLVHRGGKGVARTHMNLRAPRLHRTKAGALRNDYLRQAQGGHRAYLTGELFVGYASPRPVAPVQRPAAVARTVRRKPR